MENSEPHNGAISLRLVRLKVLQKVSEMHCSRNKGVVVALVNKDRRPKYGAQV